jgi:hypothetical protein
MFSVENLNYILYENLIKPIGAQAYYFYPFGTFDNIGICHKFDQYFLDNLRILFWDQEPLDLKFFYSIVKANKIKNTNLFNSVAISEISAETSKIPNPWYYFYHGFASLDWYRDAKYLPVLQNHDFTNVFISTNRLVTKQRAYRLALISEIYANDLQHHGSIGCSIKDVNGTWMDEINNQSSLLTSEQKKLVQNIFCNFTHNLILDKKVVNGTASAEFGKNEIELFQNSFVHLVTETVYYANKKHLTEKIFKPIVCGRPFILVGAHQNLKYLRSYGFETFHNWWDESYDDEIDNEIRLKKILAIVQKLCQMSKDDLRQMFYEMHSVIEHNYYHFYNMFPKIITNELLENFIGMVNGFNCNSKNKKYNLDLIKKNNLYKIIT